MLCLEKVSKVSSYNVPSFSRRLMAVDVNFISSQSGKFRARNLVKI